MDCSRMGLRPYCESGIKFEDAKFFMGISLLESLLQTNQSLKLGVFKPSQIPSLLLRERLNRVTG